MYRIDVQTIAHGAEWIESASAKSLRLARKEAASFRKLSTVQAVRIEGNCRIERWERDRSMRWVKA